MRYIEWMYLGKQHLYIISGRGLTVSQHTKASPTPRVTKLEIVLSVSSPCLSSVIGGASQVLANPFPATFLKFFLM